MASNSFLERVFTPPGRDARLLRALYAEFIGTLLFVFFVGFARHEPLAVGLAYGILVYATQQTSGGHLNSAITLATTLSGHFHWVTSLMYIIAQIVGGVVGALLQVALVPNVHFGQQPASPGCWDPANNLGNAELWGWEVILTFTLVYVLYSTAIATPGHGSLSPLALGFTYYVIVATAGPWTGGNANPARVIAGLIVFGCNLRGVWWIYLLGQVIGALLASLVAGSVFGYGSTYSNTATGDRREPLLGSRDTENV